MRAGCLLLLLFLAATALPAAAVASSQAGVESARVVKQREKRGFRQADPDRDGLSTWTEVHRTKTNPHKFDTDGDGIGDGAEVEAGTDPRNRASFPSMGRIVQAVPVSTNIIAPALDTAPPETSIVSGPAGTTTSTNASFGFFASESKSSFECKLDAAPWSSCATPTAFSGLALGSHSFSVRAIDAAGNTDPSPASRSWTVVEAIQCTTTLAAGANINSAISGAAGGAVICLKSGSYSDISLSGVKKSPPVTVRSGAGERASIGEVNLTDPSGLGFEALDIREGASITPSASDIQFVDDDITGSRGIYFFGDYRIGKQVNGVLIEGNNIHDLDYTGTQETGFGYGIEGVGDARNVIIRDNTIKSTAADYIQSATPIGWTVDGNTFLGPSLMLPNHPSEHQDLWQIFGGGEDIRFTNNVARNTETQESLLFQEGTFRNVVVENNLFDHDSRGYTCQILQAQGLVFRKNTIVGSHWGCIFRDLPAPAGSDEPGSGYQIDHNVFAGTEENADVSTEGSAASFGTYDWNVSSDDSAEGAHSVRNWSPSWVNSVNYSPLGLSFAAGYQAP